MNVDSCEEILKRIVTSGGKLTPGHPTYPKSRSHFFSNEYRKKAYYKHENFFLYAQGDSYKKTKAMEITWHQSPIGPLKKTTEILEGLVGIDFTRKLITEGYLKRLDVCTDNDTKFDVIKNGIIRDKVKLSTITYSKEGRTLTLGGPRSNQVVVYEKVINCLPRTRIEFRFRDKIPISHLSDAHELLNYNWDSLLQVYSWKTNLVKQSESLVARALYKKALRNHLIFALYSYRSSGRYQNEILPLLSKYAENFQWGNKIRNDLETIYLQGFPYRDQKEI